MAKTVAKKQPGGIVGTQRATKKRNAILEAATEVFLKNGYLGASMDDIAALSGVSKQTVYKHFASKDALFVENVTSANKYANDAIFKAIQEIDESSDVTEYLRTYGFRLVTVVLTPRLLRLRRLVIGEANRFPELAKAYYDSGPRTAAEELAKTLARMADRSQMVMDDPLFAAFLFIWLTTSGPLNTAMFLGDAAIPQSTELRRHVAEVVRVFLSAYARK